MSGQEQKGEAGPRKPDLNLTPMDFYFAGLLEGQHNACEGLNHVAPGWHAGGVMERLCDYLNQTQRPAMDVARQHWGAEQELWTRLAAAIDPDIRARRAQDEAIAREMAANAPA